MLLMALAPVITSLLGWIFFKERLDLMNMVGILLAVSGVLVVVQDRGKFTGTPAIPPKDYLHGILFGVGAAICQAIGLVTARPGMAGNYPALSGALTRMSVAAVIIWGIAIFQKQVRQTFKQTDRKSWVFLSIGALVGPTLGVTLSLFAVQHTAIGIASTLIAMTPVFLLPIGYFFFNERFGWGAVFGTLIAMLGVTMILTS
jgi:drug/metabolite transporter (DMT)-like permease